NQMLSNDVPLNDPVDTAHIDVKLPFIEGGARRLIRFVAAQYDLRYIRPFELLCPLEVTVVQAHVHGFQPLNYLVGQNILSHHHEIDVAGLRVKITAGKGAVEVHAREVAAQYGSRFGEQFI